jgi:hypothetical protein
VRAAFLAVVVAVAGLLVFVDFDAVRFVFLAMTVSLPVVINVGASRPVHTSRGWRTRRVR